MALPCLVRAPNRGRAPLEYSLGIIPTELATALASAKRDGSPRKTSVARASHDARRKLCGATLAKLRDPSTITGARRHQEQRSASRAIFATTPAPSGLLERARGRLDPADASTRSEFVGVRWVAHNAQVGWRFI
jgi:hypothetical protein